MVISLYFYYFAVYKKFNFFVASMKIMSSTEEIETKQIGGLTGSIAYSLIVLGLLLVIVPSLMSLTDQIDNIQDLPIIFIVLFIVGASFVAIGFITYIVIFSLRLSKKKPKERKVKTVTPSKKEDDEDLEFLEEVKEDLAEEEALEGIDEELDEEIIEEIAEEITEEILQEEIDENVEEEKAIEEGIEEATEEAIEDAVEDIEEEAIDEDVLDNIAEEMSKEVDEEEKQDEEIEEKDDEEDKEEKIQ